MAKFSWSWSRLKNYRACPKRHYHVDIRKDFKEIDSPALLYGNQFHDQMAKRIADGTPLPTDTTRHDKWPKLMRTLRENGVGVSVELEYAMDANFQPCGWRDWDKAWFRAKVDALAVDGDYRYAVAFDWKTGGKIEPEFEQLALTAQMLFVQHPLLQKVHTAYYWSQHLTETVKQYERADMVQLWGRLMPEVNRMAEAARTTTYPPKPSGLCVRYCPVTACPYHGKGSR
jgi:hypothetical protein